MTIENLRGRLIVSVQAPDGHAMRDIHTLTHVARACVDGGAAAIRCGGYGGLDDIRAIAGAVDVPVFGLTKEGSEGVYITPSVASVGAVAEAGADVVCVDATFRPGRTAAAWRTRSPPPTTPGRSSWPTAPPRRGPRRPRDGLRPFLHHVGRLHA